MLACVQAAQLQSCPWLHSCRVPPGCPALAADPLLLRQHSTYGTGPQACCCPGRTVTMLLRAPLPLLSCCRFPQQTLFYAANAASPSVRTLCEVGFGAGHSTLLYLSMNPNLTVYTFDIFELGPFQAAGADFIRRGPHGTRWHAFKGDSALTVPDFAAEHPGLTCDIVHVDGNHARPFPYLDLMNLGLLAHPYTVALIDDANDADTQADMARAVSEGIVFPPECMRAATTTDPRFASAPAWDKEFCFAFYRNATRLANATI